MSPFGYDFFRPFTKPLRTTHDDIVQEPLPRRWVDLLRYLDEKERKQQEARKRPPPGSIP